MDIIEVTAVKGFTYKNRVFVFYKKKLYQLPFTNQLRNFPQREIDFKNSFYRICRDKVRVNKIKFLLEDVNHTLKFNIEKETPF